MKPVLELEMAVMQINKRNARVELDKAWETSYTRIALLSAFTYIAIGLYLQAINVSAPWLNAIVPAFAFMLSTLTMPSFKRFWAKYIYNAKPKK